MLSNFSYIRPKTVKEAAKQLAADGARLHAGGTDLLGCLRDHVFEIKKMVSINDLKELKGIKKTAEGGLRIGALTTITEVSEDPAVVSGYGALAQAARSVASPQLRNQGTIGGNICQKPRCWYYRGRFPLPAQGRGDVLRCCRREPVSLHSRRRTVLHRPSLGHGSCARCLRGLCPHRRAERKPDRGGRKFHVLPKVDVLRETVLGPGEIVTEILLPPAAGVKSSYRKVRARASWDFALAGLALALKFNDDLVVRARAVLSGAAPVPWRSREIENAIIGRRLDESDRGRGCRGGDEERAAADAE